MNQYKLDDRIAIVTGGARGIGKGIVQKLLSSGAKVALLGRSKQLPEKIKKELTELGQILYFSIDVKEYKDVELCIKEIIQKWGKVDILVNNAGITKDKLAIRTSEEDWTEVLDTNLKGTFNCIKSTLPSMIRNKYGKIINISSIVGLMGNPGQSSYCASKAGIIGLTKSIAKEYGSKSINVNAIAPGLIDTDMTKNVNTDNLSENIILKRNGSPEDIGNLVCFLCTEDASYITGQTINVDGGLLI
tara:strand:+ start:2618 stop:3355 length:738 start_codon:yes stop_codon:yes gene_type:complete